MTTKSKTKNIESVILSRFLKRVNRLSKGNPATSDELYGRVTFLANARRNAMKRINGTRKFSVSKSKLIRNGAYTLPTLRAKLTAAIQAI